MSCIEVMPKLGLTMTEGTLVNWHKSEGEKIEKGEILFEVETDKLTNEIEAKESGVLRKILVEEGETVKCLVPVGIIAGQNEDISELLKQAGAKSGESEEKENKVQEEVTAEPGTSATVGAEGRIKISPLAKRLALQGGVSYEDIKGTGPQGRIVKKDVEAYIESTRIKVSPAAAKLAKEFNVDLSGIKKNGRIMKKDVLEAAEAAKAPETTHEEKVEKEKTSPQQTVVRGEKAVKMSAMRKVIAKRMSESVSVSPTVTYNMTMDTSELKRLKNSLKDVFKVTYTDLLIKIVSHVLKEFPLANCSVEGDTFILKDYVNMGVAVALDGGLLVPVIKDTDIKGIKQITAEFKDLVKRARENKLVPDDLSGGTFTITNLGMYGIDTFSPIINQPEVAILGVNKIVETPLVENGEIVIKPLISMSLTADHRAIDGAYAAQILQRIKQYVEKPGLLIL
ncbi:2-oxo acid dehydrogenase subunit E2 [Clostridium luticellarii]|jgi:pyruvate dehydrogenase E2 component (dihydrolipoamide acetyltransferase)|uniref:2-oxo acid dehydrogenase subunit E2 n=1 Tax=Clostridium luticellarii TaxID=1691940 RepID=UPI002357A293|nr:2-oxo acid dehydrogenase subunit E2 [Clostridium luticellarii]MCI1945089.1 2-oxo acid dehydrogenase subunit E2 [Clostridium luticellarii]MCI1968582.1 2-oxo acid dehydrogenase subunit E2 [Clostridium luticellarii]MCI1995886.1 2-oxo acid dehydrogenase subunit E2 [Clostridium luticellarii]MCI2040956.1 2-oxo acid dehydrogenase subunit E2 [Clostridium luticellarii]